MIRGMSAFTLPGNWKQPIVPHLCFLQSMINTNSRKDVTCVIASDYWFLAGKIPGIHARTNLRSTINREHSSFKAPMTRAFTPGSDWSQL
jgi:hypothetical protein